MENSASRTDPASRVAVDAQLSALLGPLRRAVLRRTRTAEDLPDLPEAQIELLRLLVASGGLTPSRAAAELNVAQSTISNLLRTMTADDLVERLPTPGDGRGAMLVASARARELLDRYDRASAAMLRETLARLSDADRRAVESAVPALWRLLAELSG
ncbi:MarR family winged helix-turn-helix transcriptional regulator [Nocardia africana]|uniref:MarR family winged helix-turn-helix transcriptional regulator n=1 Tax=Nocardia africana TaxID=134964 RepID=UPI001C3F8771|nr:MarR family transcriptional regulator [Nocardia africana]MCC3313908.1 MarR family transcriptional regulator [Nocardia africana]